MGSTTSPHYRNSTNRPANFTSGHEMSQAKPKKSAIKADKNNFFGQKGPTAPDTLRPPMQDGDENYSMEYTPQTAETPSPQDGLTRDYFEKAMEAMANKLIHTWQSTADQIKQEVRDLSSRTSRVEQQCQNITSQQSTTKGVLNNLQKQMEAMEAPTLRRRREFQQVTAALQRQGIRFRWGYPTKIILTHQGETKFLSTPEEGLQALTAWGIPTSTEKGTQPTTRQSRRTQEA
ncbi:Hypothetical predicted protein [Pelobates cultripes]|uniref:Uncharacterized protein n=1 Tax=Pelobates cultripes TaxID=61616 RepID=A0AAD1VQ46_PELCU|nr:Hypothetical predicted protein [Pelobates cultripes]CAH2311642.1 Hypothetical predicted protein [Pelobates cultripes]